MLLCPPYARATTSVVVRNQTATPVVVPDATATPVVVPDTTTPVVVPDETATPVVMSYATTRELWSHRPSSQPESDSHGADDDNRRSGQL